MKLTVNVVESQTTYLTRESIEIDTDNYPELSNMTEDEVKNYITENAWVMKPTDENFISLGEELVDQDLKYDESSNLETEFEFGN
jgi:hypothetical protein